MAVEAPPDLERWADGSGAVIREPIDVKKDLGWVGGSNPDRLPAQIVNWFWSAALERVKWLQEFLLFTPGRTWRAVVNLAINEPIVRSGVAYAPWDDKFVCAGNTEEGAAFDGFISSAPSSGDVWTLRLSQPNTDLLEGVIHNELNLWAAFGEIEAGGEVSMWTASTADGTWTDRTAVHAAANIGLRSGAYNAYNSRWIFGDIAGNQIAYTSDPTSVAVTKVTATGISNGILAIAADCSGVVLAFGDSGISRSTNGGTSWASAAGGVTDDSGSQRAAVWDPTKSRFLYGARRSSDDQLVICESPTGADGTWTVHELTPIAAHTDCRIDSILVGSRGEIYVGGTNGSSGPFLAGTANFTDWYGLDVPSLASFNAEDGMVLTQGGAPEVRKDHFIVGTVSNDQAVMGVSNGDAVARSEPNLT
jgi:hypothetical protein